MLQFVFFDVGNTLTFADTRYTLAPLFEAGYSSTPADRHAAERAAKIPLAAALAASAPARVDHDYWNISHANLVRALGAPDSLVPNLVAATRVSDRWNPVRPGTREFLQNLRQRGHRLGIISNSDGRIGVMLASVGLDDLFESVTDSTIAGFEKPAPGIFRAALESLSATPESSVYVGDIFSVDYIGARNVGMHAILMDVCGAYRDRGLPRIEALGELPALL